MPSKVKLSRLPKDALESAQGSLVVFLVETVDRIERNHAARMTGNWDQYRALSHRIRTLLSRDKERYVRSLVEDLEGHLKANGFQLAYQTEP